MNSTFHWMKSVNFREAEFDRIKYGCNMIWLVQISIALLYCIKKGRFFPVPLNERNSIFISQFFAYFFSQSVVYLMEMLFSNVFFIRFERFAHHVVSYFSVLVCYQEPNIFCVMYLTPLLLNSLHWLPIGLQNEFLYIYNVSIIFFSILTFYTTVKILIKYYNNKSNFN